MSDGKCMFTREQRHWVYHNSEVEEVLEWYCNVPAYTLLLKTISINPHIWPKLYSIHWKPDMNIFFYSSFVSRWIPGHAYYLLHSWIVLFPSTTESTIPQYNSVLWVNKCILFADPETVSNKKKGKRKSFM